MGETGGRTESGGAMPAVQVREVAAARDRRTFIRLPWRIYASNTCWVPPLLSAVRKQLDRRHPFFEHADMRLYLAWKDGRPAGRIAAIVNHLHNSYHNDKTGFWGFFEAENDEAVARALLDRAAQELRDRGLTTMLGPFNPSINSECGLLMDHYDKPPVILMPYNPPYYPELVERAGLRVVQELYAYAVMDEGVSSDRSTRQRVERLAEAVRRRHPDITVRPLQMHRYEAEVLALGQLFNIARQDNWGYVPETESELRLLAREVKPIVDPDMVLVAEQNGRPVGCILALPDINPILRKVNGRLFPFGWLHMLLGLRRRERVRVFGSACLPEYRNLGVAVLLYDEVTRVGLRRGYRFGELSWVAETNLKSMRTLLAAVEPRYRKRYCIYGRDL